MENVSQICKRQNAIPARGFDFIINTRAKPVPTIYNYRTPKLKRGKVWYIEYYYRVPVDARGVYEQKKWIRYRLKDDINNRKGAEKEEFALAVLAAVTEALKGGYNPMARVTQELEKEAAGIVLPDELSAHDALHLFLEKWKKRGIDPKSFRKYELYVNRLIQWLTIKKMLHGDVRNIKTEHIELFLEDMMTKHKYSNRESNNCHDFIRTAFNFMVKKKLIADNPFEGIEKLKSKSSKHRFYDKANLTAITKALLAQDPYTYLAFQTVYYLCVRSDKELMNLKVGNIQWEENKILTSPEGSKGGAGRYIPMDENIKKLFLEKGIDKYPPSYFIFGKKEKPAIKSFTSGFFSYRFRKVREAAGLPNWFTMYGAKHTRIIHLKSDGVSDAEIMALTGHTDFTAYTKYLRDLGMTFNIKNLNEKSRVI